MNKTNIEWVRNPDGSQGYTWNPITGCLNGCEYCYARKLANGRLRTRYLANKHTTATEDMTFVEIMKTEEDPFHPRFWEKRLREQFGAYTAGAESKGIFVCDMSDLFGIGVPEYWTQRVLNKIGRSWYREHRFYLLTKQPQNLIKFSPFPDNCWVGVTATEQEYFVRAVSELRFIEAKIKYLSFEPLLGRIPMLPEALTLAGINWVIIGAQTKPYKPPKIEWVQEIALACTKVHISIFIKDNLRPLLPIRMPFWCPVSWREIDKGASILMTENRLRQEMPSLTKERQM